MTNREGGMNLNMEGELIEELADRGRVAAAGLSHAFQADPRAQEITWDNHRWLRLRSAFAALEQMHVEFAQGFDGVGEGMETGWRTYQELLNRPDGDAPTSYKMKTKAERDRAAAEVPAIRNLGSGDDTEVLVPGAPKPTTVGRLVPEE
jgi:hypothetical protein